MMSENSTENEQLIAKVKKLEKEILQLNDALSESKKLIDIDATKAPIKLYVVGKYNGFDSEKGLLSISVEGNVNYYSLDSYGSSRLPFPDSRVLIFNVENNINTPYILGFEKGRMIETSLTYVATISSLDFLNGVLVVNTQEYGNIRLTPSREFLKNIKLKAGMSLKIRKIQFATEVLFVPIVDEESIALDSHKMFAFLAKLI